MALNGKTGSKPEARDAESAKPTGAVLFAHEPALAAEVERVAGGGRVECFATLNAIEWAKHAPPRAVFMLIGGGSKHSGKNGDAAEALSSDGVDADDDNDPAALIARVKEHWPAAPVFIVHNGDDAATVEALAQGADEFLTRPFDNDDGRRVTLRVAAMERKAARETIRFGDMVIDTLQRSVSSMKGQKFLSPTEVRLITELAKAGGSVVSRDALKTRCWPQSNVSDNALNRKLYEIRRRIKPLSDHINIRTVYGVGFVLEHKG